MVALLSDKPPAAQPYVASWQSIPPRMRVLHIAAPGQTGQWLAEAFAADSASQVVLEEAVGTAAGLARLRDEVYDAILVNHEPGAIDALDLVEGYRASGADEPIVVLGMPNEQEMAALCYEVGADGYICIPATTTRNLFWVVARAVQRHQLVRENHRLTLAEQAQLQRQRDEAAGALEQQRALWANPADDSPNDAASMPLMPAELIAHYRELLRTYVIMGSGNLTGELQPLAKLLIAAGITARQTLQLHLHVLEELVHGLGARSSRHVMARADLLVLELLLHLADGYRLRYQERTNPPVQKTLPGFGV